MRKAINLKYLFKMLLANYRLYKAKKSFKRRLADVSPTGLVIPSCGRLSLTHIELRKKLVIIHRSPMLYDIEPNEIEQI